VSAPSPAFIRKPPWVLWRETVERDVKGKGTREEYDRLRHPRNLVPWLRALTAMRCDVEEHIALSTRRLALLKPLPGEQPTEEYLLAKAEHDTVQARRLWFLSNVKQRQEECKWHLDAEGIHHLDSIGDLMRQVVQAAELLERDDVEGALGLLKVAADGIGDRYTAAYADGEG
jgi:hypothetical protein